MPMMKVFMNTCLVDFSVAMGPFNGDLSFGNFINSLFFKSGFPWKAIDYKYIWNGFWYSQFFYNCADILGFTLVCLALIPILMGIRAFYPQYMFFKRLEEWYRLSILHCLAHFVFMKVCFSVMLDWKYSQWLV